MSAFALPTNRRMNQDWMADFDDWDGDGDVDYPGGFYSTIGWDGHNGLDFLCAVGDPVYAAADGVVEVAGWAGNHWLLSGGGNVVLLAHAEHDVRTEYLHLSALRVSPGQRVARGQLIAIAGKTGTVTGAHLHFGFIPLRNVNVHNRARGRINPWPYLNGSAALTPHGTTAPTVTEQPKEWDEMASKDEIKDAIREVTKEGYGIVDSVWYRPVHGWNGAVSAESRLAGTDQAVSDIRAQLGGLQELVKQLSVKQGVTIDYAAIAKAVNDEEAKRMQK